MKRILLQFLTPKGVKAYHQVDEAGKKESRMNRRITKTVFRDRTISENPLIIETEVKSPRLALTIDLPGQIKKGLAKYGAEQDRDFTMEVTY